MTGKDMERSHKQRSGRHTERERAYQKTDSQSPARPCKSVIHKGSHEKNHREEAEHRRRPRAEKDRSGDSSQRTHRRHVKGSHKSEVTLKERLAHRNSPVQLVNSGCRSTDSSMSNSSDSDLENKHNRHRHHQHKRKMHDEEDESFEELSRRKKRIESELKALDIEEAESRNRNRKHKEENRSHNRHHSSHHGEGPVRIKQEPPSDDETQRRRRRPSGGRRRRNGTLDHPEGEDHEWGKREEKKPAKQQKEKPNFETSGKLAEDTNMYNGVVIKYNQPQEARKPKRKWRLYPFKGDVSLPFVPIHRQSAYLLGRSRLIADIPIDHPSCSKQHAVLQFRLMPYERPDGTMGKSVRPYIIDLESSNGTYVNNQRIEPRRYVELFEKDVLKFGFSTRVYVILHEDSRNDEENDDGTES